MFIPGGKGPFQAVVDTSCATPELRELRASLLASQGLMTFALPYSDYDGLPHINDLDLEYFLEALEWFCNQTNIAKTGIILASYCQGCSISYHLALKSSLVKAVVAFNKFSYVSDGIIRYKNQPFFNNDESKTNNEPNHNKSGNDQG